MKFFIIAFLSLFAIRCNTSNALILSTQNVKLSSINDRDSLVTVIIDSLPNCGLSHIKISFNPSLGQIIDTSYYSDSIDWIPKLVLYSRLSANDAKYYYFYSSRGWSCDNNFSASGYSVTIFDSLAILVNDYSAEGEKLSVPGDGFVYVSGYTNEPFYKRKQFTIINNRLQEIVQPSYYVGLNSVALKNIDFYSDSTLLNQIDVIQKGDSVSILLNAGEDLYLIKSKYDILGWSRLTVYPYDDISVQDLIRHGD